MRAIDSPRVIALRRAGQRPWREMMRRFVRFVTSDVAIAVVRWNKGAFLPPDGQLRPAGRDMMSVVLVKQAGRWLITSGHNTTIDEAAMPSNPIN